MKPIMIATIIVMVAVGGGCFSSDNDGSATSKPAVTIQKNVHPDEIHKLTTLEIEQRNRIAAIKRKLEESRLKQQQALATIKAEVEKENLKEKQQADRQVAEQARKSELKEKEQEAALRVKEHEALRNAEEHAREIERKAKKEDERWAKELALANKKAREEIAKLKAQLKATLEAQKETKRKKVAVLKLDQEQKSSIISRTIALEKKQIDAARKKRIKEIQEAEENAEDLFE